MMTRSAVDYSTASLLGFDTCTNEKKENIHCPIKNFKTYLMQMLMFFFFHNYLQYLRRFIILFSFSYLKKDWNDYLLLQVTKVRPNDQDAKMKYTECNKIVKKIAFEKAISVDKKEVNIADSINLDAMSKYLLYFKVKNINLWV